jgi:hypothetical protein
MSGANEIAPRPLVLVFQGARVLIGHVSDAGEGAVEVSAVFEYQGAVDVGPANDKGEALVRSRMAILPVAGLVSLRSLTVRPDAIVSLADLDAREAREIANGYAQCSEMVAGLRAQLAGVTVPKRPSGLIVPGRP